jgi:SPP1 gp7 family putative phage head morphogenesis protein
MKKTKKTRPLRESRKLEIQYRKALLVRVNWLKDHQAQIINEVKTQTDAAGTDLRTRINKLRKMFNERFPKRAAKRLATRVYNRADDYSFNSMKGAIKNLDVDLANTIKTSGLSEFSNIAIQNQVDLINSISDTYFDKVESLVYNGVMNGEDFDLLGKKIQDLTGATAKRAKFIARDQTATLNSIISKKRAENAGIAKSEWVKTKFSNTSNYTPRESHIKADGKIFDLDKGLKVDGEFIFPGQPIGCTCTIAYVMPN